MVDITKDEIWDEEYVDKKSTSSILWKKMIKRNKVLVISLMILIGLVSAEFILIYKFVNLLITI